MEYLLKVRCNISGPWIRWQTEIIPLCISAPGTYILVCEICVQLQNTQIYCPHAVTVGIALKGNLKVIQALIMIKISVKPSLIRAKEVFLKPGVFCFKKLLLIFFRTSTENYLSYWWMRDIYSKLPYQYRKNLKGKITCDLSFLRANADGYW